MAQNLRWTADQLALYEAQHGKSVAVTGEIKAPSVKVQGTPAVWPKQNKWERQLGDELRAQGHSPMPQALTFRLARATSYTPDFISFTPEGIKAFECKGFWRQAGRIKLKMAARLFPAVTFIAVTRPHGKKGGWCYETISA